MFSRGCSECGDMGHFVRYCPRKRRGGLHKGSHISILRVVQPQTRRGVHSV